MAAKPVTYFNFFKQKSETSSETGSSSNNGSDPGQTNSQTEEVIPGKSHHESSKMPEPQTNDINNKDSSQSKEQLINKANKKSIIRSKVWQERWLQEFSWLRKNENNLMFCSYCEKLTVLNNTFVSGCKNYQHSALLRHMESKDHIKAKDTLKQKEYMVAAKKCINEKTRPVLEAQIKTALYIAENNLPNRQYLNLIDLQLDNGASVFSDKAGIYTNNQAASLFQKYVANVLMDTVVIRLRNSPFIGIMLDESLDIAVNKKLVLFCKILHDRTVKIEFCANVTINDGKAETVYNCILNFLQDNGIDIAKVSGLGSDGASVMMGRLNGVGVRMKSVNPRIVHIWCAAHRLALVSFWAAKKIPYMKVINETLINIYNFYQYSAPRYQKLRELQKIMKKTVKRFRKPTQVRWLSLCEAIACVHDSFSSLILGLEHEIASSPASDGSQKARGILKRIRNFKFVSVLSLLRDILQELKRVSKLFQSDNLDIASLKTNIQALKQTLRSNNNDDPFYAEQAIEQIEEGSTFQGIHISTNLLLRRHYVGIRKKMTKNLVDELEKRFPLQEISILNDLNRILNPSLLPVGNALADHHALDSLQRCIDFYGNCPTPLVDSNKLKRSFRQFKNVINENRDLSLTEFCIKVIYDYKEAYPDFATLASILCTCPLTSVPCERGFSL